MAETEVPAVPDAALDMEALRHVAATSRVKPSSALTEMTEYIAPYAPGHTVSLITNVPGPAPAWYHQETGEVAISLRFLDDVDDAWIVDRIRDLGEELRDGGAYMHEEDEDDELEELPSFSDIIPGTDRKFGTVIGIFQHEIAHSTWSRWLFESRRWVWDNARALTDHHPAAIYNVFKLWEETRIEKRAYDWSRVARFGLRHSFSYLVELLSETPPTNGVEVSNLWALTVGRSIAGIAESDEVIGIHDMACTMIGDQTVNELREIMDQAVAWDSFSNDLEEITILAGQWLDALGVTEIELPAFLSGESADDVLAEGEAEMAEGDGGEGDEGDDEADGSHGHGHSPDRDGNWSKVTLEDALRMLEEIKRASVNIDKNVGRETVRLSDAQTAASAVFGKDRLHEGRAWHVRPPTAAERQAVGRYADAFSSINHTGAAVRKSASVAPPGRIRSREAVRRSAERSQGRMVTAKPWTKKRRRHTINPPITLGLMTDTSGSMHWAQTIVASSAYIFANAISRVGGRAAAVTFGNQAEAVLRAGDIPDVVAERSADGGHEEFEAAIAALDGVLHLSNPGGAKVLVVISDGHLVKAGEIPKAEIWLERLHQAGTAVVWLDEDDRRYGADWIPKWVEQVEIDAYGIDDAANKIANAMERAFQTAQGGQL